MSASIDDVTDLQVERCLDEHTELHLDCPYCPTRADLKICARCETEVYPHETCQQCPADEGSLLVDGFGTALVMPLPAQGVAAA